MRKGIEHGEMAERHGQAADTINRQLEESIYRDDVDELARLEEKHAKLTGERDRRKAVNVWLRKNAGMKQRIGYQVDADTWAAVCDALKRCSKALTLTVDEVKEIGSAAQHSGFLGYPPYAMTNIGASIRRVEQRIPAAREKAAARAKVEEWKESEGVRCGTVRMFAGYAEDVCQKQSGHDGPHESASSVWRDRK